MSSVTKNLNTQTQLDEVKAFQIKYRGEFASARRSVEQSVENAKNNVAWMDNFYDTIMSYLEDTMMQ